MSGENLDEMRTAHAYRLVLGWRNMPWLADAVRRARGLPVEVRTQGLNTAVATLLRESSGESGELVDSLGAWLLDACPKRSLGAWTDAGRQDGRRLLDAVIRADRASYRAAQEEALAYLGRVKLLADAVHQLES